MNFKRIQGIFLIIFIAIDVFLFVFYNRSSVTNSDSSSGSNILEEMRKDQISFNKPANSAHEGSTSRRITPPRCGSKPLDCNNSPTGLTARNL